MATVTKYLCDLCDGPGNFGFEGGVPAGGGAVVPRRIITSLAVGKVHICERCVDTIGKYYVEKFLPESLEGQRLTPPDAPKPPVDADHQRKAG